jgi:3-dehydroquinate dehydratase-2
MMRVVATRNRIEVMHGVNLDMLGRRDPAHYGSVTLTDIEITVGSFAGELGLETRFFQSNAEGEFVERLHKLDDLADGVILNPGAWTHYSWAIHDALEIAGVPAVEVHLSNVQAREEWRRVSVISDLVIATIAGEGVEGYRRALHVLKEHMAGD